MQPSILQWFIDQIETFSAAAWQQERRQLYADLLALNPSQETPLGEHVCLFVLAQIVAAHQLATSEAGKKASRGRSKAAAKAGFDEIQFDFVRYPAVKLILEGVSLTEKRRRVATISEFLRQVTSTLRPYNVYVGATVLGSVCSTRQRRPSTTNG